MSWNKVSSILTKKGKTPNLKDAELTYELSKKIQENWEKIFGKLANQVVFSHLYNGIIVVETENPMWASELTFYKKDLVKKTNDLIKKAKIYDIRIHVAKKKESKNQPIVPTIKLTLEEKIKAENKRKKEQKFDQCPTCHTWWEKNKICLFCSSSPQEMSVIE